MSWRSIFGLRKCTTSSKTTLKSLDFSQMPGPRYYPILGPINDIITFGKNERLHLTVDDMHKKYGNIFRARIETIDAVFLSSADYIRAMYAYEGKYPKHPVPPAWLYFNEKFKVQRGLLFMDDKEWLEYRQIMNVFLLKDAKWTEKLIEMTCDNFTSKVKRLADSESAHQIDNLEDELYLWSIYSILNLMLGSSTSEQSDRKFDAKVWEFVTVVKKIFDTSSKLMSISPRLADKIQMRAYRDFEDAAQRSITISRSLIAILSNEMQSSENGLLRKMRSQHLNDDMIVRIFSDLIIAAGDTTINSVLWMLYHIAKDRNLQDRLKQEIKENPNTMESPVVRGCVREVLRLYPLAPFVGRFIDLNAEIGSYSIPKGTLVLASLYTTGRDPLNFSDPQKFIPDRWLRDENSEHKVFQAHATTPFAMGSRSCVGKKIALYQIHSLVTKILQQFTLESQNKDDVNFKLNCIGVPDKKILIAFRRSVP